LYSANKNVPDADTTLKKENAILFRDVDLTEKRLFAFLPLVSDITKGKIPLWTEVPKLLGDFRTITTEMDTMINKSNRHLTEIKNKYKIPMDIPTTRPIIDLTIPAIVIALGLTAGIIGKKL